MKTKKSKLGGLSKYGLLFALIIIIIFFHIVTNGSMLTPVNITNVIMQNSYIMILAIGMLYVIIAGDFDMSVGYGAGLIGASCASMIVDAKTPAVIAVVLCIIIGIGIGLYQGYLVSYLKIPAFVVTLGGMMTFHGLMLMVLHSNTIGPTPDGLNAISNSYMPDIQMGSFKIITIILGIVIAAIFVITSVSGNIKAAQYGVKVSKMGFVVRTIVIVAVIMVLSFMFSMYNGIPLVLILMAIILGIYSFIGNKTKFGRRIYALGGNEKATRLSGVNTKFVKLIVFANMGLMTAVAGIVYDARINYATPTAGSDFAMDAIAACFIGGASSKGGAGTVFGTVIGALIMGVLNNGMQMMGLGTDIQQFVKGLVLVFSVLIDVLTKSGKRE